MIHFSFLNRKKNQKKLQETEFDILIIGGGITGAGIALDAASRGMKVALIEKNDFASGTSSKSTKLIHGGLRYLKQFDFWLVKEVGTERAIVHQIAPHLVIPEKMILPLIDGGTYGTWLTSIGLKIYDVLASVEAQDKRKMLNKQEALQLEPLLPESILKGAGYYVEYRTDDARLTIEILKTASQYNAQILNYTKANEFIYKNNRIIGAKVTDAFNNESYDIKAKYVVNATGAWVDDLRQINNSKIGKKLHLTKGVHLVVAHSKFPIKQSIYFDVPDGRMIFAIPRGKITYFGTTDTNFQQDKNSVEISIADATYLITAVNNMFPSIHLTISDIESSWAGLRPLIYEQGKSVAELSRKDEIFVSDTKLISIAGGKLTGYRKMAERVVNLISKKMLGHFQQEFGTVQTEYIILTGGSFEDSKSVNIYIEQIYSSLKKYDFIKKDAAYLVHNYGRQTNSILDKFKQLEEKNIELRLLKAEIWFTIQYEMTCTPTDFFMRRTGRLFFDKPSVDTYKKEVLNEFIKYFNWSDIQAEKQRQELKYNIKMTVNFN